MSRYGGEENRLSAIILRHLAEWLRRVLDAVLAGFRRFGVAPDPTAVYSQQPDWERRVDAILPELASAHEIGWHSVLPDEPLVSTDSFIQAQIAHTRNLLVRIPDEVYQLVFAEISDGVNEGESIPEIAARIERVLEVTGSERWPSRARTIAVTEVNRAGNSAAYAAALQAERMEGVPMVKVWLNSDDRRVRPAHRRADGQEAFLAQPFDVGGSQLLFPGDPTGLPSDVINCRCGILVREARRGDR